MRAISTSAAPAVDPREPAIERALVDCSLLTRDEVAWWNAYHTRVLDIIGPQVSGDVLAWLEEQCRPL